MRRIGLVVALVVLGLGSATAQAAYPGKNGEIAFRGPELPGAGEQIWLVGETGARARAATEWMFSLTPRWSPDGASLVVAGNGANVHHAVAGSGGGLTLRRSEEPALPGGREFGFGPLTTSPDGRRHAARYLGGFGEEMGFAPAGLYAIDRAAVPGTGPDELARASTLLTRDGGEDPVWSPDGRSIAHTGCAHGDVARCGLWLTDVAGAAGTRLVLPQGAADRPVAGPDWSPDGDRLVLELGTPGGPGAGVWTVRADGSGLRRLHAAGRTPAFSPDGRRVVLADDRGLVVIAAAGGSARRIFTGPALEPDWQPRPRAARGPKA